MIKLDISLLLAVHIQTSNRDFCKTIESIYMNRHIPRDIIVIQDGPIKNDLHEDILKFKNSKKINQNILLKKNLGLANALNEGLKKCRFNLVARLDPEDEVINDRFYHQYLFMTQNTNISVCGSFVLENYITSSKIIKKPITHNEISKYIKCGNPLIHSTVIFRKNKIIDIGGYPNIQKCQDLFLWVKCLQFDLKLNNLQRVLVKTYLNKETMRRRDLKYFIYELIIYKYQYQHNLISLKEFILNCFLRFLLRAMPIWLRNITYKSFR